MRCDDCKNWTTARVTRYGDGSEIVNWRAPEGKGECSVLKILTPLEFGCTSFVQLPANALAGLVTAMVPHVTSVWKNGAPWQHWVTGPCPDCRGQGSNGGGACHRCAGVGKVQYHDDGYISDNHTKVHPRERETVEPLRCKNCKETVDIKWKACPMCGTRLEPVAETEYVGGLGNSGGDFKANGKTERAENLRVDIDAMNERNAKIAALRRMTVENGCTEAEADTARQMVDKLEAMQ